MKNTFLLLGLLGVFGLWGTQTSYGQKNVLFIMADDFNHWPNGYYPQVHTPNLDSLAAKGIMFTDAHCSSPVCNPSRNALWSGYRPSTTQIWKNGNNPLGDYFRDVPGFAHVASMNQHFTESGYWTHGSGKLYHKGKMGDRETDPGNWSMISTKGSGSGAGNNLLYQWEGSSISWKGGSFDLNTANDVVLAQEAANLISNYASSPHSNKPFFIACGLFRPHLPWNVHKDFYELFDADTLDFPKGYINGDLNDIPGANPSNDHNEITADGVWKEAIQAYLANCAFADYNVGILLNALENSPYKDSTIVVFMGDHGWHLGEKSRWRKFSVYDQANHTSLIIYDPTAPGNGNRCKKVVSLQDVYPTLAQLAGIPKNGIEGRNLAPLLEDPERVDWDKPVFMSYSGTHIIKTNKWRFVSDGNKSQLYDIEADPYEFTNLYGQTQYNGTVLALQAQLDSLEARGAFIRDSLANPTALDKGLHLNTRPFLKHTVIQNQTLELDLLYTGTFVKLEIINIRGKKVWQKEIVGEMEVHLPLPGLPAGIYFLNVMTEGEIVTEKFLIQ